MKKNDKEDIRRRVHFNIVIDMMKEFNENYDDKVKYLFDDKYIETPEIVIADFWNFVMKMRNLMKYLVLDIIVHQKEYYYLNVITKLIFGLLGVVYLNS